MRHQKGFTLIELMIAIVIIGVITTIGISAYNRHVIRAQIAEVFSFLPAVKTILTEELAAKGMNCTVVNGAHGRIAQMSGRYVQLMEVTGGDRKGGCGLTALLKLPDSSPGFTAVDRKIIWLYYYGPRGNNRIVCTSAWPPHLYEVLPDACKISSEEYDEINTPP